MEGIFFIVLLISLFLLSRLLTATLTFLFLRITRNHGFSIQLLSLLFLPGVIIHELAHWLIASILFVPTGEIEFLPQVHGDTVKLGSVQVGQTDPFRRFAIGVAPLIVGLFVILSVFWFFTPDFFHLEWTTIFCGYVIFEIGNTMFSSKKDLEGVIGFLIFLIFFSLLLFFLHVPLLPFLTALFQNALISNFFSQLDKFLLFAVGIDVLIVLFLQILSKVRK